MTGNTPAPPRVLVTSLEPNQLKEGFAGSVMRIDSEEPEVWWISFAKSEVNLSRIARAFLVLLLDFQTSFLPRILIPYHPPGALLTSDGELVTSANHTVERDWLAILRSMKVEFVPNYREFFGFLEASLVPGEGYDLVGTDDPFFRPGLCTRNGPAVPPAMLEQIQATRG